MRLMFGDIGKNWVIENTTPEQLVRLCTVSYIIAKVVVLAIIGYTLFRMIREVKIIRSGDTVGTEEKVTTWSIMAFSILLWMLVRFRMFWYMKVSAL